MTSIPALLAIAAVQLAVFVFITDRLARRSNTALRWVRIFSLALTLLLLSVPFHVMLLWHPPEDSERQRNLELAAVFVPITAAQIIAFRRVWQERRRKNAPAVGDGR